MRRKRTNTRVLNVLIGCEISGLIRDEFVARGHNAFSCDLFSLEQVPPYWPKQRFPERHLVGDVRYWAQNRTAGCWDLAIFMPPCTYLANSGVRWLYREDGTVAYDRWELMRRGADFFRELLNAPIPHIAVENPVQHRYARERIGVPFTQTVQPWQFGHAEVKRTCLWLKNLPPLVPTKIVPPPYHARVWKMGPHEYRQMDRSLTYPGIAKAMADQWTAHILGATA